MIKRTELSNGVVVITEEIRQFRSVSLGYFTRHGARGDRKELAGLSHLLEHMLFRGTRKRGPREIAMSLENRGGSLDALTAKEFMTVYAKVLDEDLEMAMDVVGDLVSNPILPENELEKEKGVILEEYRAFIDSPEDLTFHNLIVSLFPNHPLSVEVLGRPESIKRISRSDVEARWREMMSPASSYIVAAGNLSHKKLISYFERYFSLPGKAPPPEWKTPPRAEPDCSIQIMERLEQAHVAMATRIPRFDHPLRYALVLIHSILGSGMGSRLFYHVREEKGLVYTISSFVEFFMDVGIFGIYFSLEPKNIEKAIKTVQEQLDLLLSKGITKEELSRAKQRVRGSLALNQESSFSRMSRLASLERYLGRIVTVDQVMEKYASVSESDTREAIEEFLNPELFSISIVGSKGVEKWKGD